MNKGFHGETFDSYLSTFYIDQKIDDETDANMEIRVGPVLDKDNKYEKEPGIWIESIDNILILLSKSTWDALNKHVQDNCIKWEKELNDN